MSEVFANFGAGKTSSIERGVRPITVGADIDGFTRRVVEEGEEFAFPVGHGGNLSDRLGVVVAAEVREHRPGQPRHL